jgi:hypothetical protein
MSTSINPTIAPLDRITPADETRSGAKAYNCARLKQAGFPVPDGLVVLSTATDADLAGRGGRLAQAQAYWRRLIMRHPYSSSRTAVAVTTAADGAAERGGVRGRLQQHMSKGVCE